MHKFFDYKTARRWLLFWTLFIGLGAVAGASVMLADPTGKAMGMDAMLPYFQVLPFADILFQDFLFSGFALLFVNGLTNLTSAVLLIAKRKIGIILGGIFGITLMLWICIQFYIFPPNFMSTVYFIFGLFQTITGYIAFVRYEQEQFTFYEDDYENIGSNPRELVVFFSRDGYTKKIAYEEANRTGAAVFEIVTDEKTDGIAGFLWCGRFGMHRWQMKINHIPEDIQSYNRITICSPIWVFALASPVRTFCQEISGKIKCADLITVHYTKGAYRNALNEVETLTGVKMKSYKSICCRFGKNIQLR